MSVSLSFASISLAQTSNNQQAQSRVEQEAVSLYSSLSSLSMDDRKELFGGLTSELKSELWKVHLKSYIAKHPSLTEKQRSAIHDIIALLTPNLYEISPDTAEGQKVHSQFRLVTQRLLEVFPREVARELLNALGGSENQISKKKPMANQRISLVLKPNKEANQASSCTCNRSSDWCPSDYTCIDDGCTQARRCGTMWWYTCDGVCAFIIECNC